MNRRRELVRSLLKAYFESNETTSTTIQRLWDSLEPRLSDTLDNEIPNFNTFQKVLQGLEADGLLETRQPGLYAPTTEILQPRIWIEKTALDNRPARQSGKFAYGKALWSPQTAANGARIYETMQYAAVGDVVIHLRQDDRTFAGVSQVASELITSFTPPDGTQWTDDVAARGGYLHWLDAFTAIEPPLPVDAVFKNPENQPLLDQIAAEDIKVVYSKNYNLNQGAYLTYCPDELASLIAVADATLADALNQRGIDAERITGPDNRQLNND
jgi:hypothetical protein